MTPRPDHAIDCQACAGWTTDELLCPRCSKAVHRHDKGLWPLWLKARATYVQLVKDDDGSLYHKDFVNSAACVEAFQRGFIVGTARVLNGRRTQA